MFFYRYHRYTPTERNARIMSNARRKVRREQESVALFPELARFNSVEECLDNRDGERANWNQKMRSHLSTNWRTARLRLRNLPQCTRAEIIRHWNSKIYPGNPIYLLDVIRRVVEMKFSVREYEAGIKLVRVAGEQWRNRD